MTVQILVGDCRERMREMAAGSVHCAVTSPPYWGLRSYGVGSENGELGLESTPDCGRPLVELREDLTDTERAYVMSELEKLDLLE